jgi:hypothetical protein
MGAARASGPTSPRFDQNRPPAVSRSLVNLVVLPPDAVFGRAPAWASRLRRRLRAARPAAPESVAARSITVRHGFMMVAAAVVLLAAVVVSPFVTPYRLVLAPRTFALCLVPDPWCAHSIERGRGCTVATDHDQVVAAAFFLRRCCGHWPQCDRNYGGFLHIARDVAAIRLSRQPEIASSLMVSVRLRRAVHVVAFDPSCGDLPIGQRSIARSSTTRLIDTVGSDST